MVILLPAIVCLAGSGCASSGPASTTRVPGVVGAPLSIARRELRAQHLRWHAVMQRHSSPWNNPPAGTVMVQRPAGGSRVAPGSTVSLVVHA
jgi:beta-lactam-binding protein with PASTA domain